VTMKGSLFWDMTPCSLVRSQRFKGSYKHDIHSFILNQKNQQHKLGGRIPSTGIFLGLILYLEDGECSSETSGFLRNTLRYKPECCTFQHVHLACSVV
jgi:hypothetical protein